MEVKNELNTNNSQNGMNANIIGNLYDNINFDEILFKIDIIKNKFENLVLDNINMHSIETECSFKRIFNMIKLLIKNDGSMTNFLNIISENLNKQLKMDLIENKIYNSVNSIIFDKNTENIKFEKFFENLQNKFNFNIRSNLIIKRVIEFYHEDRENIDKIEKKNIMYGISFWDEEKYKSLYENDEERKKPLGLILREKKIEFFKDIENFYSEICENEERKVKDVIIIRVSKYYKEKNLFFFLFEIFELKKLFELLINF